VLEAAGDLGFDEEAGAIVLEVGLGVLNAFQCHVAAELVVLRDVDFTEAGFLVKMDDPEAASGWPVSPWWPGSPPDVEIRKAVKAEST